MHGDTLKRILEVVGPFDTTGWPKYFKLDTEDAVDVSMDASCAAIKRPLGVKMCSWLSWVRIVRCNKFRVQELLGFSGLKS